MSDDNRSVDSAITALVGKPVSTHEIVLKDTNDGWKTSIRMVSGEGRCSFIVKEYPQGSDSYTDDIDKGVMNSIQQLSLASKHDQSVAIWDIEHGIYNGRPWSLTKIPEHLESLDPSPKWNDTVGLANVDARGQQGSDDFVIPKGPMSPLPGRVMLLAAITHTDESLIKDLATAIKNRLGSYCEYLSDERGGGEDLVFERRVAHEMLHNTEQPCRFSTDRWTHPCRVPKIENCLKKYESLLGDPKGMIRTIYAKKSHGDLWVNNLLFAINKENVDVYLIDPMNMAIRIDGDIEYAEFPEGHKSRFSYNHPSDVKPIPDILFDVAQLIASILVSLPYQDTQSNALSELTTETHKNSVLKDKMKVLRKGLLESWTKGNHVTRNTHSFLSIMQKWIEDDLLAGVFLTNEKDIREHMSLLLVDRILYYSGFVLIELQNHEKVHTEFIDYIAQLIDVVLTEPEP